MLTGILKHSTDKTGPKYLVEAGGRVFPAFVKNEDEQNALDILENTRVEWTAKALESVPDGPIIIAVDIRAAQ